MKNKYLHDLLGISPELPNWQVTKLGNADGLLIY